MVFEPPEAGRAISAPADDLEMSHDSQGAVVHGLGCSAWSKCKNDLK